MNQSTMTSHRLTGPDPHGSHNLAYTQWGDPENPQVLVCVHGLTRNSRDFDFLAKALVSDYRIICPDLVGRGNSDWLTHPEDYEQSVYLADMVALLEHLNLNTVDWLGTSMGGLIGMLLAAQPHSPIRRLVLNDIGPFIPQSEVSRLAQRLKEPWPHLTSLLEVEQFLRFIHRQFGPLTDAQWQHLAQHSARQNEDGSYRLAYDRQIVQKLQAAARQDVVLWEFWEKIRCPVLLLHGQESMLLTLETIAQMQASHPNMQVVTLPGIGHAPALMADEQIQLVKEWLLTT